MTAGDFREIRDSKAPDSGFRRGTRGRTLPSLYVFHPSALDLCKTVEQDNSDSHNEADLDSRLSEAEDQGIDPSRESDHHHPVPKWPTTDEIRERLTRAIHGVMNDERFVLIPAPTSSGKSYNGATTRWRETGVTGDKPVVHLHYSALHVEVGA
jgi:hypothetical protein